MSHSLIALGIIPGQQAYNMFENERQQRRKSMADTFNSLIDLRRNILMARYQDQNMAEREADRAYQNAPTRGQAIERGHRRERSLADAPEATGGTHEDERSADDMR